MSKSESLIGRGHPHALRHTAQYIIIPTHNLLIATIPPPIADDMVGAAQGVRLKSRQMLYEAGDEIHYVYFPIDCVISSLTLLEDGSSVEIAMTGREGLVGIPALVGGGRSLHWTRAAVAGTALRISRRALATLAYKHDPLQIAILKSYRNWFSQICQRSVCNVRHSLLQRLCGWLLMMGDRLGHRDLPFTQEEIAGCISVRRAGVSVAITLLQSLHGVTTRRGKIVIVDRDVLEREVCECYSILKAPFR